MLTSGLIIVIVLEASQVVRLGIEPSPPEICQVLFQLSYLACPFLPLLCVLERWWLVHVRELGSRKEERIEAAIPETENAQREIVTGVRVLAARGSRNNSETS